MVDEQNESLSLIDLKICTQNIQGQGSQDRGKKLKKVSKIFRSKGYNVGFFQETRTDNSEEDLKKWQKHFQTKQVYFTKYGHRERGAAIVIDNEDSFRVEAELDDPEGRFFGVIGDHNDIHCLLLSIYAPYVEADLKNFIKDTIYKQLEELGQKLPEFVIIGGDFNVCMTKLDKEGGRNFLKETAIIEINRLLERFSLLDIFRTRNPKVRSFTFEKLRPTILRERLDYFFISSKLQDYINENRVYKNTISDHDLVSLHIKGHNVITRGPGLYKFNNSMVNEPDFVLEMKNKIPIWIAEAETGVNTCRAQWDFLKHKMGEFSREFGRNLAMRRKMAKMELESKIEYLSSKLDETNKAEYETFLQQLDELIEQEVKGSIIRSHCQEYEEGEKSSKYFFGLEKLRAKQKNVGKLRREDGSYTTKASEILEECKIHFKERFSKNENVDVNNENMQYFFENVNIPKLDEQSKNKCDEEITLELLEETLKTFKNNKSPGEDGLTKEFYVCFWTEIKDKFFAACIESKQDEKLSFSQTVGVITLLEKKGKSRLEVGNWRPITLLNFDYKLISKTIANKIKSVLGKLINKDQNGFVPDGNIFFSLRTITDILFHCKKENIELFLIAIDYTRAFDCLEHSFLFKTLETFNFGKNIIQWVKTLHKEGKSCVITNGYKSGYFDIERSARQGDPLAPYAFVLALEILLCAIRQDPNIQGITISEDNEIKLSSFADDCTYFLKNENSAILLIDKINEFSLISGLEINKSKSECLYVGNEIEPGENVAGIPYVDMLKILGFYFGHSKVICEYNNFYNKLAKMQKILNIWRQRHITIFGKNLLINALILSLVSYQAHVKEPPEPFKKELKSIIKTFLWSGGVPKIAHNSAISDWEGGGFRCKQIDKFLESLKIKFLKKINFQNPDRWMLLPIKWITDHFGCNTSFDILSCQIEIPDRFNGNEFYFQALKSWERLTNVQPQNITELFSMNIWFNRHLKTNLNQALFQKGFVYIKDLFPENKLVDPQTVLDLTFAEQFALYGIKRNLPNRWVSLVNTTEYITIHKQTLFQGRSGKIDIAKANNKDIYEALISSDVQLPIGFEKWCLEYPIDHTNIGNIFKLAKSCANDTFTQCFQYKILCGILPTQEYLFRYRVPGMEIENNHCLMCKVERGTMEHCLFDCEMLQGFLDLVKAVVENSALDGHTLSRRDIIFGRYENLLQNKGLNHFLLELKKFIFYNVQKDYRSPPELLLRRLLSRIKLLIIKEKQIAIAAKRFDTFEEKWAPFCDTVYNFYGPDNINTFFT